MIQLSDLLPKGRALPVYPLRTVEGIKAIDVVWLSHARRPRQPPADDVAVLAPEICVEVAARHNPPGEIEERTRLYFQRGATECWVCDVKGRLSFYDPAGKLANSAICPAFPVVINDPEADA